MSFFQPLLSFHSLAAVDLAQLQSLGIQALLLDLDNTLMLPHNIPGDGAVPNNIRAWLDAALAAGLTLICVTNNKSMAYCHRVEDVLGFSVIHHAKKPFGDGLKLAIHMVDISPRHIAVVGDRPTTDGWGAFFTGCHYIQTRPLRQDEPAHYHLLRALERRLVGKPILPVCQ